MRQLGQVHGVEQFGGEHAQGFAQCGARGLGVVDFCELQAAAARKLVGVGGGDPAEMLEIGDEKGFVAFAEARGEIGKAKRVGCGDEDAPACAG